MNLLPDDPDKYFLQKFLSLLAVLRLQHKYPKKVMESLHLLTLPREIRDIIYQHYLYELNGYHFDFEHKEFRTSTGASINVSLKFACKQTYSEINVTALTLNVLNFSSVSNRDVLLKARQFHTLLQKIESAKEHAIKSLAFPQFAGYRTSSVNNFVDCEYRSLRKLLDFTFERPEYDSYLEYGKLEIGMRDSLGEAPSLLRSYMDAMVYALSKDPDFVGALAEWKPLVHGVHRPDDHGPVGPSLPTDVLFDREVWSLFHSNPKLLSIFEQGPQALSTQKPWSIPSEDDLKYLNHFHIGRLTFPFDERHEGRFSAAAVAITYLKAVEQQERLAIRQIVLHETHGAAAYPECHGLGLIPFCQENPLLRVSRQVNFWRTVISPVYSLFTDNTRAVSDDGVPNEVFHEYLDLEVQARIPGQIDDWVEFEDISVPCLLKKFAGWIIEASQLSAAGMPDGSFTLLFDADNTVDQASKFFELLKLQLAWQQAWDHWTATRPTHCSFRMRRLHDTFLFEGLPQAVDEMIKGRSPVMCSFPIGEALDIAPFIDDIPEEAGWCQVRKWRRMHEY